MFLNWQSPDSFIKLIFELASKLILTQCKPIKCISIKIFYIVKLSPHPTNYKYNNYQYSNSVVCIC